MGVHGHAYTLDLPSSMATHPTFYVGLLKPYRPAGADDPVEPTASQNIAGRHSPSSGRALPTEAGQEQEQEPERGHEPLRGEPLAPPSGPHGHTGLESSRGAALSFDAPIRRSPRLANSGTANGRRRHQPAQAEARRGLADSPSPAGLTEASSGGPPHLGRKREAPPSRSAGHPAVAYRTQQQSEGPPGQGESQSGDAERPGPTPLPLRAPLLCLVMRSFSITMSRCY
ncbi:hypothetical protein PF005_g29815 [Phytophthora fragariae]|uniref:Uncharacterized protein n=1 Tax=Phytophthora fragariae TaxID=53985 RepID=A0A6A3VCR0_9STRA|nr:hypothetical protein PF005_g29815 [Phytophthora fragariae]